VRVPRKRDSIQKIPSTIRLSEVDDSIIKRIQCRSASWKRKLTDRSKVVSFALEFMDTNLSVIDSSFKENVKQ